MHLQVLRRVLRKCASVTDETKMLVPDGRCLRHLVPFLFTKYLQEAFGCYLVVQMTDDEKYLWKNLQLSELRMTLRENVRDIIAYGASGVPQAIKGT